MRLLGIALLCLSSYSHSAEIEVTLSLEQAQQILRIYDSLDTQEKKEFNEYLETIIEEMKETCTDDTIVLEEITD